jgi:hypothetical protein
MHLRYHGRRVRTRNRPTAPIGGYRSRSRHRPPGSGAVRRRGCSPCRSGCRACMPSDLEQLEAGLLVYDAFYRWCRDASRRDSQRHRRVGAHRHAELRRAGRPDRGHAPHSGGGEALDRREAASCMRSISACCCPGPRPSSFASISAGCCTGRWAASSPVCFFVLPGLVAIMALSWLYALYGNVGFVEALFFGLKAAVLAIVLQAVVRIGSRALRNRAMVRLPGHRSSPSSCSTCCFRSSSQRRP